MRSPCRVRSTSGLIDTSGGLIVQKVRDPDPPHGHAALKVATFSEGKTAEYEKHGCIKEFSLTGDDAMRGAALDPGYGCRADAQIE